MTKPSEAWKFSIPENSDTLKGCPTKFFDTVRQKKLTENGDTPPLPPLLHKFFRYQKFSETQHRGVPPLNFSALWDKTTSTEKRESPFLIPNIFWYPNLMNHYRIPLRKLSALWDKKLFTENGGTPSPLLSKISSIPEILWNRRDP